MIDIDEDEGFQYPEFDNDNVKGVDEEIEEAREKMYNPREEDDPESEDEDSSTPAESFLDRLLDELSRPECYRSSIMVKYDGKYCEVIPMARSKKDPQRFVFKIGGELKGISLKDIDPVYY